MNEIIGFEYCLPKNYKSNNISYANNDNRKEKFKSEVAFKQLYIGEVFI